jgi:hypothetical protein
MAMAAPQGGDEELAGQILNLSGAGANVELLDQTVNMFYGAVTNEQVRGDAMIDCRDWIQLDLCLFNCGFCSSSHILY